MAKFATYRPIPSKYPSPYHVFAGKQVEVLEDRHGVAVVKFPNGDSALVASSELVDSEQTEHKAKD